MVPVTGCEKHPCRSFSDLKFTGDCVIHWVFCQARSQKHRTMKRKCLFAFWLTGSLSVIVFLSADRLSTAVAEGVDPGQTANPRPLSGAKAFIQRHCADCHDSTTKEAGLDLTKLPFDPEDKSNLAIWVRVHDRVGNGEMPPKTQPRPEASELKSFVNSLASTLIDFEKELTARQGRSVQRRLNRYE